MTKNTTNKNWGNMLQLGIPIIDNQHIGFLNFLDDIQNLDLTNNPENNNIFMDMLNNLKKYMKDHFLLEEKLMQQAGYQSFKQHRLEHQYFLNKIDEFKLESQFNSIFLQKKLLNFMKKWFLNHIIQTDSKYKPTIKKHLDTKKPIRNLVNSK